MMSFLELSYVKGIKALIGLFFKHAGDVLPIRGLFLPIDFVLFFLPQHFVTKLDSQ